MHGDRDAFRETNSILVMDQSHAAVLDMKRWAHAENSPDRRAQKIQISLLPPTSKCREFHNQASVMKRCPSLVWIASAT